MTPTIPASSYGTWPIAPKEMPPCTEISAAGHRSRLTEANREAILSAAYCTAPASADHEVVTGESND